MKVLIGILPFLFLVFSSNTVSSQTSYTIKGKVTDLKTGESMIGVHVVVKDKVYGTVTGNDGSFTLKTQVKPPFVIQISYVGYEPMVVEVKDEMTFLDIKIKEQNKEYYINTNPFYIRKLLSTL